MISETGMGQAYFDVYTNVMTTAFAGSPMEGLG